MNKFDLTDTSIIDAIRLNDIDPDTSQGAKWLGAEWEDVTVPYLVMKVTEVGPVTIVEKSDGDSYPKFTFILKNEQNEEERIIEANVFGQVNVDSFFDEVKPDTVIAIKNAVATWTKFDNPRSPPYSLKLLSCAKILHIKDEGVDEKEVFFMKLRYGTSDQQLERVKSHYERLLRTSKSD